jgi:hypothetical protein
MAWETRRNGRRYYYRVRRENGRVVRDYFGAGPEAEALARAVEAMQILRRCAKAEREQARQFLETKPENELRFIDSFCDQLARAALEEAGFHQHARGQWRKARTKTTKRTNLTTTDHNEAGTSREDDASSKAK